MIGIVCALKYDDVTSLLEEYSSLCGVTKQRFVALLFLALLSFLGLLYGIYAGYLYNQHLQRRGKALKMASEAERQALTELFEALDGKNWKDKTRWCTNAPVSQWKGVHVSNKTGKVNKIILAENRLSGFISEAIGVLDGLVELDLR
jgi:hypothetical protein